MRLALLSALLVFSFASTATPVDVGGASVEIPAPPGFVRVTPEMTKVAAYEAEFIPPNNHQLAAFIAQDEAPTALADGLPEMARRFSLQVPRKAESISISVAQFGQFRAYIKANEEKAVADAKAKVAGYMGKASSNVSQQLGTDLTLKLVGVVPLPPHVDSDRALAFSAWNKNEIKENGETRVDVTTSTTTILLVNGRLMFLYCFGGKDDLEWTQEQSKQWATSILNANPVQSEAVPAAASAGFDWDKVSDKAISGALLGAAFGFASWLRSRAKKA